MEIIDGVVFDWEGKTRGLRRKQDAKIKGGPPIRVVSAIVQNRIYVEQASVATMQRVLLVSYTSVKLSDDFVSPFGTNECLKIRMIVGYGKM